MSYLTSIEIPTIIPVFHSRVDQLTATKALRTAINQPWSGRVSLVKTIDYYSNNVSMIVFFFVDDFTKEQIEEYKQLIISRLPT